MPLGLLRMAISIRSGLPMKNGSTQFQHTMMSLAWIVSMLRQAALSHCILCKENSLRSVGHPMGRKFALAIQEENGSGLYLMSPDGSTLQRIPLNLPSHEISEPIWSPDGEWIAFLSGESYVYRVRPDGSNLEHLAARTSGLRELQWSPDGRWLLFEQNNPGHTKIYQMRADGSALEMLMPGHDSYFSPRYAPVTGSDWHPLPLGVAMLGIFAASFVARLRR